MRPMLLAGFLVAGCASMSQQECANYMDGWWVGNAEYVRRADSHEGPN